MSRYSNCRAAPPANHLPQAPAPVSRSTSRHPCNDARNPARATRLLHPENPTKSRASPSPALCPPFPSVAYSTRPPPASPRNRARNSRRFQQFFPQTRTRFVAHWRLSVAAAPVAHAGGAHDCPWRKPLCHVVTSPVTHPSRNDRPAISRKDTKNAALPRRKPNAAPGLPSTRKPAAARRPAPAAVNLSNAPPPAAAAARAAPPPPAPPAAPAPAGVDPPAAGRAPAVNPRKATTGT